MMVICDKTDIVNEKMEMLIVVFKFFFYPSMNPIFPLRYWNEEFLVVLQHNPMHEFNNIFVWSWKECKDPTFLFR